MLVRILSNKIYFLCFFLASFLIALIYYFYIVNAPIKLANEWWINLRVKGEGKQARGWLVGVLEVNGELGVSLNAMEEDVVERIEND